MEMPWLSWRVGLIPHNDPDNEGDGMARKEVMTSEEEGLPPGWTRGQRRTGLLLLCLVGIVNLLDRQAISMVLEPIKHEFHVTDTQLGLLTGATFALVYATLAIPMARLVDTGARKTIFALCIGVWGLGTMLAGVATSFAVLLTSRVGVAAGESASMPATHSMAADLYPRRMLPMALGLMTASNSMGVALSLFLGGWLSEAFGWRVMFIVIGIPALLLAFALQFGMRDPPRRTAHGDVVAAVKAPLREVLGYLGSLRSYLAVVVGLSAGGFSGFAMLGWGPSFLIRVHGLAPREVGFWFGLAAAAGLGVGALVSGKLCAVLGQRNVAWYLRLGGAALSICVPVGLMVAFSHNAIVAVTGFFLYTFFSSMQAPACYSMIQSLARPGMRGTAIAACALINTLVGSGLGPFIMGVLNDHFGVTHGAEGIRYSMACVMIGAAIACCSYLFGSRFAQAEYARVDLPRPT